MPKLVLELTQHTPILHFQNEAGATIRGTELKPALDRFLLRRCGGSILPEWKLRDKNNAQQTDDALRYRVTIQQAATDISSKIDNQKWGNIGVFPFQRINKRLFFSDAPKSTTVTFISNFAGLLKLIEEHVFAFFACHNFGFQKLKGFGSYTVSTINGNQAQANIVDELKTTLMPGISLYEIKDVNGTWQEVLVKAANVRKVHKAKISISRQENVFLFKPVNINRCWRIFVLCRTMPATPITLTTTEWRNLRISTESSYTEKLNSLLQQLASDFFIQEVE